MKTLKTRILFICLSFSVILLSGCSTVSAPGNPSESWLAPEYQQKKLASDPIWDSIRERKISKSEELDLLDLLDIALKNNPQTRQAWQTARAREAEVVQSGSTYFPQLTADTGGSYHRRVIEEKTDQTNNIQYAFGADATMLVLDFGGRRAGVKKARELLLAANYQFNQAIQDLVRDTATSYYSFYAARAGKLAAEADVKDAEESLVDAKQRFKAGLVSKLDVLQAESTYNNSLFSLEGAKGKVETARASLAEVMGVPANADFKIAMPSSLVPKEITRDDVSQFIEEALKNRPDIASARSSLKAKEAEIDIATSNLLPSLNIGGSVATNSFKYYGNRRSTPTSYKDDYLYSGQFSVDWNIFDGLKNYFTRIQAQREADAEMEKLVQAEISASADVWTKYFNLKTAQKQYVFSEAFLASAEASHELAVEGYKAGLKNILDLLQAQSQLSEARSTLITSRKDFFVAVAELAHAVGGLAIESE